MLELPVSVAEAEPISPVGEVELPAVVEKGPDIQLPEPPRGYWNRKPQNQWADFALSLPGTRLVADAQRGISIRISNQKKTDAIKIENSIATEVKVGIDFIVILFMAECKTSSRNVIQAVI